MANKRNTPPAGAIVNDKAESVPVAEEIEASAPKRAKRAKKSTKEVGTETEAVEVKTVTEFDAEEAAAIQLNSAQAAMRQLREIASNVNTQIFNLQKKIEEATRVANKETATPRRQATLLECNKEYFAAAKADRIARVNRAELIDEVFGGYRTFRNPRTGEETVKKVRRNLR